MRQQSYRVAVSVPTSAHCALAPFSSLANGDPSDQPTTSQASRTILKWWGESAVRGRRGGSGDLVPCLDRGRERQTDSQRERGCPPAGAADTGSTATIRPRGRHGPTANREGFARGRLPCYLTRALRSSQTIRHRGYGCAATSCARAGAAGFAGN